MIWILLMLLVVGCTENIERDPFLEIADKNISIEIASTPEQRTIGLMKRSSLAENSGMLFIFEDEQPRSFWMKDTFIPLDIIFFDKNFAVVSYIKEMRPCLEDPCPNQIAIGRVDPAEDRLADLPSVATLVRKYSLSVSSEFILPFSFRIFDNGR